jgi:GT2 family glycosyltransferase
MKLSILMPVYNERTVVERCISLVLTAPLPENMERELVIVDDCSTDGTFAILERLAAAFPQIQLHQHPLNRGKGAAVRRMPTWNTIPVSIRACCAPCSMAMPTRFSARATWPATNRAFCPSGTP